MTGWTKEGNFETQIPNAFTTQEVIFYNSSANAAIKEIQLSAHKDGDFQIRAIAKNKQSAESVRGALKSAGFPCVVEYGNQMILKTRDLGHLKSYLDTLEIIERQITEIKDELYKVLKIDSCHEYYTPPWIKTGNFDFILLKMEGSLLISSVTFLKMCPQTNISKIVVCGYQDGQFQLMFDFADKIYLPLLLKEVLNIPCIIRNPNGIRFLTGDLDQLKKLILAAEVVDPNISAIKHEIFDALGITPIQVVPASEPANNDAGEPVPQTAKNDEGEPVPQAATNSADNIANAALRPKPNAIVSAREKHLKKLVAEADAFIGHPLTKRKRY